jgi:hypothetical protein
MEHKDYMESKNNADQSRSDLNINPNADRSNFGRNIITGSYRRSSRIARTYGNSRTTLNPIFGILGVDTNNSSNTQPSTENINEVDAKSDANNNSANTIENYSNSTNITGNRFGWGSSSSNALNELINNFNNRSYADIVRGRSEGNDLANLNFPNNVITRRKVRDALYNILESFEKIKESIPENLYLESVNNLRTIYDYITQNDSVSSNSILGNWASSVDAFSTDEKSQSPRQSQNINSGQTDHPALSRSDFLRSDLSNLHVSMNSRDVSDSSAESSDNDSSSDESESADQKDEATPSVQNNANSNEEEKSPAQRSITLTARMTSRILDDFKDSSSASGYIDALIPLMIRQLMRLYEPELSASQQNNRSSGVIVDDHRESRTRRSNEGQIGLCDRYGAVMYDGIVWSISRAPLRNLWQILIFTIWFLIVSIFGLIHMVVAGINRISYAGIKKIILFGIFIVEEIFTAEQMIATNIRYGMLFLILRECLRICRQRVINST